MASWGWPARAPSNSKRVRIATPHPWTTLRSSKMGPRTMQAFMLMGAPLDIILEVFRYLHPFDLLSLARTCNRLRQFLMDKEKSKTVWHAARGNIEGLPDCPSHLSEPAYANLAFDPHCHNCLSPGSHCVVWELSGRYCARCLDRSSVKVVWSDAYARTYIHYTLRFAPDLDLAEYIPCYATPESRTRLYSSSVGKDFVEGYSKRLGNQKALDVYLSDWKDRMALIQTHVEACYEWYPQFLEQRMHDIIAKLRYEPWTRQALAMMSKKDYALLRDHPAVTLPRVLTDSEWKGAVRDAVVVTLSEYQHAKLKQMRRDIIIVRLQILRQTYREYQLSFNPEGLRTRELEFEAKFADVALMPELRALVEASFDAEIEVGEDHITAEIFQAELASLPDLRSAFNFRRQLELSDNIARALGCQTWIGILELAVAWFTCEVCQRYVRWPEVLAHLCQRPGYAGTEREEWAQDYYPHDVAVVSGFLAWSSKTLRPIVPEDISTLRGLITVCGLDPATATAAQMDALDARVTYKRMASTAVDKMGRGKVVMTWRRAVLSLPTVRDCGAVRWARLSDVEKRRVRPYEKKARAEGERSEENTRFLSCALCDEEWWLTDANVHGDVCLLAYHLRRSHHVAGSDPEIEDKYMYMHPDGEVETPAIWV